MRRQPETERGIQTAIRQYLEWRGARVERLNSGAIAATYNGKSRFIRFTFPGCPDLVALLPDGRTLWVEVKRPGGKLSPAQVKFRDDCLARGVPHVVATSVEDVEVAVGEMWHSVTSGVSTHIAIGRDGTIWRKEGMAKSEK